MAEIDKFVATYEVNTGGATDNLTKLEEAMGRVEKRDKQKIAVEIEVDEAKKKVDELNKRINALPPSETVELRVELKKAEADLNKAKTKLKDLEKAAPKFDKLKDSFKELGTAASSAMGKLNSDLGAVSSGITGMMGGFTGVAVAIGAVTAAMAIALNVSERLNANWKTGQELGVGTVWTEEYRRKFQTASGGRVTGEQGLEGLGKLREKVKEGYSNLDPFNQTRRAFGMVGMDVNKLAQMPRQEQFAEIAKVMAKLPESGTKTAQAFGQFLGLSPAFVEAMKTMGASMGVVNQMTKEQAQQYIIAEQKNKTLNEALNTLKEQFDELKMALAPELIRILGEVVNVFTKMAKAASEYVGKARQSNYETPEKRAIAYQTQQYQKLTDAQQRAVTIGADKEGLTGGGKFFNWVASHTFGSKEGSKELTEAAKSKEVRDYMALLDERKKTGKIAEAEAQYDPSIHDFRNSTDAFSKATLKHQDSTAILGKNATEIANTQGEQNAKSGASVDAFARAMNMFVGATATFANAIDDQQAIAAWAGEVGRSAGIAPPHSGNAAAVPPTSAQPVVMHVDTGATAAQTPTPGGRVAPATAAPPVTLRMQPATTLPTLSPDQARGPQNQPRPAYSGQTRQDIQVGGVYETIAQRLGLSATTLKQGQAKRGDVEFAAKQRIAEIANGIVSTYRQVKSQPMMPEKTRQALYLQMRNQLQGLENMYKYSMAVTARQKEGGREITLGERAVVINVNGSQDPAQVAKMLKDMVYGQIGQLANDRASPIKR